VALVIEHLVIDQNAAYRKDFEWYNPIAGSNPPLPDFTAPILMAGWHARMEIRAKLRFDAQLLDTLDDGMEGGIELADGRVSIVFSAAEAMLLAFRRGYYDLILIPPSGEDDKIRFAEGTITVKSGVTV
jgi:hypothetical protein